ncbi:hypothetical protein J3A78_002118 [Streptomyces sp. PvR006]|uniref:hypothetical protein n=1 Tax=Streptomyces sp. PvR006 TaxID=2817860 RepID=UPI001AEB9443|nr:hypothetical protein [Streptomyces sp. PvR006]MBP2581640.1 hypothetical protein [Streptomyces sp. PvR006]
MSRDHVMSAYQQQLDRIQRNRTYSDHAKKVLSAQAYKKVQAELETLRKAELDSVAQERTRLQRRMFGATSPLSDPNAVIARRDANDRAAKLNDAREAADALERAERDGDTVLAQAVASRAAEYGWGDVVGSYAASRPGFSSDVEEWNQLPDTEDFAWKFSHTAQFVAPTPPGFDGSRSSSLDWYAQQSLDDEPAPAVPSIFGGDAA